MWALNPWVVTAPAFLRLHLPLATNTPVFPVPTVRSPPGLAKTPLSALGLKPHNPAEILLHPVGGECRHGGCRCFSGGVSVRIPLEESPGWRRHFCLIFGPGSLGVLVTYCEDSGSV